MVINTGHASYESSKLLACDVQIKLHIINPCI